MPGVIRFLIQIAIVMVGPHLAEKAEDAPIVAGIVIVIVLIAAILTIIDLVNVAVAVWEWI